MALRLRCVVAAAVAALAACANDAGPGAPPPPGTPVDPPSGVPHLVLSATSLDFTWRQGRLPAPQEVQLENSGRGVLHTPFVGVSQFWMEAAVEAREGSGFVVTVTPNPVGLAPGRHEARVTVWSNADNSPAVLTVVLDAVPAAPGSIGRVVMSSSGFLLTGQGDGYQPMAQAYDARGDLVDVPLTWRSSAPDVVDFDPNGIAWGGPESGAAVVTVEAGGVSSPPAVVLVAAPAPGTLVVQDGDVLGLPGPLHPGSPFGPGWSYLVDFYRAHPYPVDNLVGARGPLAFAGRVLGYPAGVGGDRSRPECRGVFEAVPLWELFPTLEFSVDLPLRELIARGQAAPGVTCTGAGGAQISLAGRSLPPPELDLHVEYAGGLRALRLVGHLSAEVAADVALPAGFAGEVECRADPVTVELPWPGVLLLSLPSRLTYGAVFALSAEVAGPVHAAPGVTLDAAIDAGIRREGGAAVFGGRFDVEVEATPGPAPTPATGAYRVEARPGVVAELTMGPTWLWDSSVPYMDVRVGKVSEVTRAPVAGQAGEPGYCSSWTLATLAGAAPTDDPAGELQHLALSGSFTSLSVDPDTRGPPWASATGVLAAVPRRITPGGSVELSVTLDPLVAPEGATPVSRVEVLRRTAAGLVPVCAASTSAPGQLSYTCTAAFPDVVAGDRIELHAFAVDPGGALATEVACGAPAVVEVE